MIIVLHLTTNLSFEWIDITPFVLADVKKRKLFDQTIFLNRFHCPEKKNQKKKTCFEYHLCRTIWLHYDKTGW